MAKNNPETQATSVILDSVADGVFTVDKEWRITSFNRAAENITGISRSDAIGQRCCDIFKASICENDCALRATLDTRKNVTDKAIYIIDASGRRVPISISTAILRDSDGQVIGGVETFRDLSDLEELRRALDQRYSFQEIVAKSSAMLRIFDTLPVIAESDSTVLIEGESGTGKELIARAIHNLSHRADKPVVAINCGALPDTLLESELFGHTAGAFTDARTARAGRFARAEGGTLFLDEIGDISPALQVRLLRVLQERTYEPLGSNETVTADVRIVVATNRNLQRLVKNGKFRDDLFYRINVISIKLPPLRERREDIPLLVEHFIERLNNTKNKLVSDISPDALGVLMNHDFPGNVRELENIVERAFVMCRGSIIHINDLPDQFHPKEAPGAGSSGSLEEIEAGFIADVLRKHDHHRGRTAAALGMHKTTLWRKMKKYGLS
ncbi:MAG: sigma 54-interacting transcriptional regulator [candidate division Zixibacteria bacterium]|nr:sigma 54-interacting transcriptional regulator [candidate division Zixibacteria bacterium]